MTLPPRFKPIFYDAEKGLEGFLTQKIYRYETWREDRYKKREIQFLKNLYRDNRQRDLKLDFKVAIYRVCKFLLFKTDLKTLNCYKIPSKQVNYSYEEIAKAVFITVRQVSRVFNALRKALYVKTSSNFDNAKDFISGAKRFTIDFFIDLGVTDADFLRDKDWKKGQKSQYQLIKESKAAKVNEQEFIAASTIYKKQDKSRDLEQKNNKDNYLIINNSTRQITQVIDNEEEFSHEQAASNLIKLRSLLGGIIKKPSF